MIHALVFTLTPGRDEARRWAEKELAKPEYRDSDISFFERIGRAFQRLVNSTIDKALDLNNPWLIIVFALVIVGIIVFFVWRANRGTGDAFSPQLFDKADVAGVEKPSEYRKRAADAASTGDWDTAVQEMVRASVAHLARAGAVELRASSTAHELTQSAATTYPHLGQDLSEASNLFDAVSFSTYQATQEDYAFTQAVDAKVTQVTKTTPEKVGA
ncbi:DUF4129 domain-containing protein [Brevibacterium sp. UMB10442]|nr:DUF4129 domain-containing protein [Brevibacterium sp. UMB10442]